MSDQGSGNDTLGTVKEVIDDGAAVGKAVYHHPLLTAGGLYVAGSAGSSVLGAALHPFRTYNNFMLRRREKQNLKLTKKLNETLDDHIEDTGERFDRMERQQQQILDMLAEQKKASANASGASASAEGETGLFRQPIPTRIGFYQAPVTQPLVPETPIIEGTARPVSAGNGVTGPATGSVTGPATRVAPPVKVNASASAAPQPEAEAPLGEGPLNVETPSAPQTRLGRARAAASEQFENSRLGRMYRRVAGPKKTGGPSTEDPAAEPPKPKPKASGETPANAERPAARSSSSSSSALSEEEGLGQSLEHEAPKLRTFARFKAGAKWGYKGVDRSGGVAAEEEVVGSNKGIIAKIRGIGGEGVAVEEAEALGVAGRIGVVARFGGRLAWPVAVGLSGLEVYHAVRTGDGKTIASASGHAVGGLAGAYAGGEGGAAIGAGIGAFFFGAGAVPGAIIGGLIGGVGGYIAGSWGGRKIAEGVAGKPDPIVAYATSQGFKSVPEMLQKKGFASLDEFYGAASVGVDNSAQLHFLDQRLKEGPVFLLNKKTNQMVEIKLRPGENGFLDHVQNSANAAGLVKDGAVDVGAYFDKFGYKNAAEIAESLGYSSYQKMNQYKSATGQNRANLDAQAKADKFSGIDEAQWAANLGFQSSTELHEVQAAMAKSKFKTTEADTTKAYLAGRNGHDVARQIEADAMLHGDPGAGAGSGGAGAGGERPAAAPRPAHHKVTFEEFAAANKLDAAAVKEMLQKTNVKDATGKDTGVSYLDSQKGDLTKAVQAYMVDSGDYKGLPALAHGKTDIDGDFGSRSTKAFAKLKTDLDAANAAEAQRQKDAAAAAKPPAPAAVVPVSTTVATAAPSPVMSPTATGDQTLEFVLANTPIAGPRIARPNAGTASDPTVADWTHVNPKLVKPLTGVMQDMAKIGFVLGRDYDLIDGVNVHNNEDRVLSPYLRNNHPKTNADMEKGGANSAYFVFKGNDPNRAGQFYSALQESEHHHGLRDASEDLTPEGQAVAASVRPGYGQRRRNPLGAFFGAIGHGFHEAFTGEPTHTVNVQGGFGGGQIQYQDPGHVRTPQGGTYRQPYQNYMAANNGNGGGDPNVTYPASQADNLAFVRMGHDLSANPKFTQEDLSKLFPTLTASQSAYLVSGYTQGQQEQRIKAARAQYAKDHPNSIVAAHMEQENLMKYMPSTGPTQ